MDGTHIDFPVLQGETNSYHILIGMFMGNLLLQESIFSGQPECKRFFRFLSSFVWPSYG